MAIVIHDYTVKVQDISGGHRLIATRGSETQTIDIMSKSGGGTGGSGADGFSPIIEITEISGGHRLTVTDVNGTESFDVLDGAAGEAGPAGPTGKTAYQYAQDGGYTGTEAEFAAKLAKEIPEPYTLPVATADTLGGVKVGEGFDTETDGTLNAIYRKVELINSFTVTEDVDSLTIDKDADGNPFELKVALMYIQCGEDVAAGTATGSIIFSTPTSEYFARIYYVSWEYPGYKVSDTYVRPSAAKALCDASRDFAFIDGINGDEGGAGSSTLFFPGDRFKYAPNTVIVKARTDFKVPKNAKVWLYGVRRIEA